MPKRKATPQKINDQANDSPPAKGDRETIQGYFRKIFQENPKLLQTKSNEELLKRWLADHPGASGVPYSVKIGLQNIKSVFRSRRRKRKAVRAAASTAPRLSPSRNGLVILEEQIDECLIAARLLDREGLESVISHLRRARNEVVWKMGQ